MIFSKKTKLAALVSTPFLMVLTPVPAQADTPYLGELIETSFTYCPKGYLNASGQILPIQQNAALFSLLGTTFGGNGTQNFALPNLNGRTPIHVGQGPGLSNYVDGQQSGRESVTVLQSQIPAHSHVPTIKTYSGAANTNVPTNNHTSRATVNDYSNVADPAGNMAADAVVVNATGGSQPLNVAQPGIVIKWCIATQGIFPSRN